MRFLILTALAMAAIPAAANAQAEPALTGPFYVTGAGPNGTSLVAMGSRVREGDRARITRIIMLPAPADAAGMQVWRIDATAEFDCARNLTRPLVLTARDDTGTLVHSFNLTEDLAALPPGDPTAPAALAVACSGKPPEGAQKIDDLTAWQTRYRAEHSGGQ